MKKSLPRAAEQFIVNMLWRNPNNKYTNQRATGKCLQVIHFSLKANNSLWSFAWSNFADWKSNLQGQCLRELVGSRTHKGLSCAHRLGFTYPTPLRMVHGHVVREDSLLKGFHLFNLLCCCCCAFSVNKYECTYTLMSKAFYQTTVAHYYFS